MHNNNRRKKKGKKQNIIIPVKTIKSQFNEIYFTGYLTLFWIEYVQMQRRHLSKSAGQFEEGWSTYHYRGWDGV